MSSSCFLPLWESLQDQQVGLTQAPFTLLLLPRVSEHEILCAPFKNGVYFPQPYGSPESKFCWPSKPNVLELLFLVQESQAEEQLEVWLRPLAFQGETLKL